VAQGTPTQTLNRARARASMADVAVAGGGLAGQITALMLARSGHQVVLFDSDAGPPDGTAEDDFFRWRGLEYPRVSTATWRMPVFTPASAFLNHVEEGPAGPGPLPRAEFEALLR
jgi:choline dehydrogenase-like flavoprotein